ncbi:MAG: hypothetical protein H6970_10700 [Gammaproteobacteria bacterium]|nr:hypothetical protein [Gammaproteobacteria bacterium]MCP5425521.1 hypothetical protein [Gammaproteobacteria bacterium]MCP5459359.1 hypothetical protein [Gammaproteobacteria bacterium]
MREIAAASGDDPLIVLQQCVVWSDPCYAIVDECVDDIPLALFGASPDPVKAGMGRVWLLGSDDLAHYSATFLRHSREWVEKLHEPYPVLWNYIDARNELHLRWLNWCGFRIIRRIECYGPEKRPFYEFEKVREGAD